MKSLHCNGLFTFSGIGAERGAGPGPEQSGTIALSPCPVSGCNVKAYTQFHITHLFPVPVPVGTGKIKQLIPAPGKWASKPFPGPVAGPVAEC